MRKFTADRLLVATHNNGKLAEMVDLFAPLGVQVIGAAALGLPEPEETETTFVGNARIKAHAAAAATGLPALADDSGLCIDALGGFPGVFTADWAETPAGRDFDIAMRRAWNDLQGTGALAPISAQFRCTLVLAWPDAQDVVFEGVLSGQITWPMRGANGHGFDPIFQPDGYTLTFAEMAPELKNRISHRADAFRKLVAECFT